MPELLPVAHGAAHDLAQDVAAALVAGQDAVGDEEGRGAEVVGDDAQRDVVVGRRRRSCLPARAATASMSGRKRSVS